MFFDEVNYRSLLRTQSIQLKKISPAKTLKWLAERSGIQAPYLTNVLKERAHLSADQLYALGEQFGWSEDQKYYIHLLLEWERCAYKARKDELKKQIEKMRKAKLEPKAHLKQKVLDHKLDSHTRFFLNPYFTLVDAFLSIPRFSENPEQISKCLNLSASQIKSLLDELVELGFLEPKKNGGYKRSQRKFHLPKESPLCEPYRNLMQQASSNHLQTLPNSEKYGFTASISADPETYEKIQKEFLSFLKKIEPLIKSAPSEEIYGMRFDLFRWSYEKQIP